MSFLPSTAKVISVDATVNVAPTPGTSSNPDSVFVEPEKGKQN